VSFAAFRFVVVGGGITGLSAAHRLCELSRERGESPSVLVLEASERFGGHIRTERVEEMLIEGGPDSFLTTKPAGLELCERLGLGSELVRIEGAGGPRVLVGGRLHEIPAGFLMMAPTRLWPFVRSSLFSPAAKLRIAAERFLPASPQTGDESLASFVVRRFGREALERVAEPVAASLFMADADKLSIAAALPRFVEMERSFGSVTRGLLQALAGSPGRPHGGGGFAYVASGTATIVERLLERLPAGAVRARAPLNGLTRSAEGRWRLRVGDSDPVFADAVVLACPAYASATALGEVDPALADELGRLRYASCATVSLCYRTGDVGKPLAGYGFFVPRSEGIDLLAASFTSLKFPKRVREGELAVRCFLGGALRPALADLPEEALAQLAHAELRSLLGIAREPLFARTIRFRRAMPQYEVGFPERAQSIARRAASRRGLVLAGSALGAVGLPDCIHSGEQAAEAAWSHLLICRA
jgi:protoporphyrinogen/coproporphyrinogen III oxidase